MSTSYTTLLLRLKRRLRATDASDWTDGELADYLSDAERWLAHYISQIRKSGRFQYEEEITWSADSETFAQSALTKAITGIRWVMKKSNDGVWQPLYSAEEGDENLYRMSTSSPAGAYTRPRFWLQDPNIHALPTISSDQTLRIRYQWLPVRKGTGGTAETPEEYDDIIVLRAAHDALGVVGNREETFEQKYATRLAEVEDFEFDRWNKGTSETIKNVNSRGLFPSRGN